VRGLLLASFLVCTAGLSQHALGAPVGSQPGSDVPGSDLLNGHPKILRLKPGAGPPTPAALASGEWDAQFELPPPGSATGRARDYWLKIDALSWPAPQGLRVLVMHATRQLHAELIMSQDGRPRSLPIAANLPGFLGIRDSVFAIPEDLAVGQALYAHVVVGGAQPQSLSFSTARLDAVLSQGAERARMIAFAFGALCAVSLAALLIWFVLKDRVLVLYATLFFLQALYVAFLSGQGFDWPWLAFAMPFASFAWNIPAALSGGVACLFTREIADLQRYSPRVYSIFGSLSGGFVLLACANAAKFFGFGPLVNALGNIMFLGLAIFTAAVCFFAWRRGNRAAGWFLIAWALLEGFTFAAAAVFLLTSQAPDLLYYDGLPLSMVAASVLIALGVADRLRAQRAALTEAERRAQTDPLTGVLNRNSLIERLHAACLRAQARGLPIGLLFIDLDHFKQINDSFGHQAGDACLRAIIPPIHAELRQSDVVGRYGGEEFVVILSSADAAASIPIAQRILERVAEVQVDGFGLPIRLTCSIGVAASDTLGVWGEHLVARADAAVYAAKRAGRNQLYVAQPEAS
jgi:two-component system, sensor histidine kinase LadS